MCCNIKDGVQSTYLEFIDFKFFSTLGLGMLCTYPVSCQWELKITNTTASGTIGISAGNGDCCRALRVIRSRALRTWIRLIASELRENRILG